MSPTTVKLRYKKPKAFNISFDAKGNNYPSDKLTDIVLQLQEGSRKLLLSFSGKDSLATWLFLREAGFEIIPYWCYLVPGLSLDEKAIDYYEKYFKTHIIRMPHPQLFHYLSLSYHQPPERISILDNITFPSAPWGRSEEYEWKTLERMLVQSLNLQPNTYTAVGVRAADNQQRARMIAQNGAIGRIRKYYWAIWDWKLDDVLETIKKHKVKLFPHYQYWGSTGDQLSFESLKIWRDKFPKDYAKIQLRVTENMA